MTPVTLEHSFKRKCHNLPGLLAGCVKVSTYIKRLAEQSLLHPDRYDPDKYKGDGLELFVEALLKLSPVDCRLGITNYQIEEGVDTGVDGHGIGIDGKVATVQVKYRSNTEKVLTANEDHLSNFTSASVLRYGVDPSLNTNMLIITTAEGLHYFTNDEMFQKKVRCIGNKELRELVDNNTLFWNAFRELCVG
jgi:hypothetical protein